MTSNAWRIVFGVPIIFQVLQILGLLLFVRYDYDKLLSYYLDRHNNPHIYRKMVNKLYLTEDNGSSNNQDTIDAFMELKLESNAEDKSGDDNEFVTLGMAFSRKYI